MVSAGRVGLLSLGKTVFGRYESARLVHGRMWPMRGDHYDNIFLHYKVRLEELAEILMILCSHGEGGTRGRGRPRGR